MIVHNGVKVCFFMFLVGVRKDRKHGVKWYAYKHKQKKPRKKSKSKNITCTPTYKLTALNLRIFQYVIIIYTNNSMNIIFSTYMYIFLFMREKKAERKKADGAMVALRHSCLSGFAYQKDLFRYFKKASYILLTNSWGCSKDLLNSFNNILKVSLILFKFTVL